MVRPRSGLKSGVLEVFKFGLYLCIPFTAIVYFGDPEWYKRNVLPYRSTVIASEENSYKPPKTHTEVHAELEKIKARRHKLKNGEESVSSSASEPDRLV